MYKVSDPVPYTIANVYGEKQQTQKDPAFVNIERDPFMSAIHSAIAGTGDALTLYGAGTGSQWMSDLGDWINSTSIAKQDLSEIYNTKSDTQDIIDSSIRSMPTSGVLLATTLGGSAAGSLIGPEGTAIGGTAGAAAGGAALARGIYKTTLEKMLKEHPDWDYDKASNYALLVATNETATELAGTAVDVMTAKMGGSMAKKWIAKGLETGILDAKDIITSVAKKEGAGTVIGKILGSSAMEGTEGVVNDKFQYDIDKAYGLNPDTPDYFKTFLIGSLAAGPMVGAINLHEAGVREKVYSNLEKGLTSDDIKQREYTANQVKDVINKVSPEAAKTWDAYVKLNVEQGPLNLNAKVDPESEWKLNVQNFQTERQKDPEYQAIQQRLQNQTVEKATQDAKNISDITNNPAKILEEAGIPTDTPVKPELTQSTNTNQTVVSNPEEPQWKQTYHSFLSPEQVAKEKASVEISKFDKEVSDQQQKDLIEKQQSDQQTKDLNLQQRLTSDRVPDQGPSIPQWKDPITARKEANAKMMESAMGQVHTDTNNVNLEQLRKEEEALRLKDAQESAQKRFEELSSKSKLTMAEKQELRKLKQLAPDKPTVVTSARTGETVTTTTTPQVVLTTPEQVQQTKVETTPVSTEKITKPEQLTKQHLENVKVSFDYYGPDVFKDINAHQALSLLEGDEKIYDDLLKCVRR